MYVINQFNQPSGSAIRIMKHSIIELETYISELIIAYYKGLLDSDELDNYIKLQTMKRYYLNH